MCVCVCVCVCVYVERDREIERERARERFIERYMKGMMNEEKEGTEKRKKTNQQDKQILYS